MCVVFLVQNGSLHQKDTVHDNDFEPYLTGQSNQVRFKVFSPTCNTEANGLKFQRDVTGSVKHVGHHCQSWNKTKSNKTAWRISHRIQLVFLTKFN